MVGLALTFVFALGAAGLGMFALRPLTRGRDPALEFGAGGLCGLGVLGTATLGVATLPGGTSWGIYPIAALSLGGLGLLWKLHGPLSLPKGKQGLALLAALLMGAIALVGVLSPSDSLDWDTLAYHLAVPKIWLADGQMHYISFIHHSNFPAAIDDLYLWGISWGGQAGAKAFSAAFGAFGGFALFGFARSRYSQSSGWWSLLVYAGIPLVGWECGTGYIDVGNGLFAGLGILFTAAFLADLEDRNALWLAAIFLGFAAASKYTGLQTLFAACLVALLYLAAKPGLLRLPLLAALVAGAIASPWYLKNVVNTGNPVYPFFYSVFKGKNWDAFSDNIYKNQQQTFGVGRPFAPPPENYTDRPLQPGRFGGAVLGLAYEPGRYADPQPTSGEGFPFVSIGAVPLCGLLLWVFSGKSRRFELAIASMVLISLLAWFVLSEQSRYIVGLFFPACVMTGGAVTAIRRGPLLAAGSIGQLLASAFILTRYSAGPDQPPVFAEKLRVVLALTPREDYEKRIGFYVPAQELNMVAKGGRVALFDEVFGYLLDVPYFWANPGHTTEMGYEQMTNSEEFVASLKRLGITHVYINLNTTFGGNRELVNEWGAAAGLSGPPKALPNRDALIRDPQSSYKVFLADALASGKLTLDRAYGARLILLVP